MLKNPNGNRTQAACILIEQFRRKGYNCEEIKDEDVTILIMTHEKKPIAAPFKTPSQVVKDSYRNFIKAN